MKDPYGVLGVARDADQETIRKAYKKLARQYHPDVNKSPGAEERFKEVNAAYDVLGDENKRKLFDEFGEVSTQPGFDPARARAWSRAAAGGHGGGGGFEGGFGEVDVEDLLGSLFGAGGFGRQRQRRGRDVQVRMRVEPLLAITGGETMISVPRPHGSEQLKVRIPAGVRDGGRLRLAGQGLPPPGGGSCGDLHIILEVPEHPLLRRKGDDLEMELPITVLEAIRGASIPVPTPTGEIKVTVPPGSPSGRRLRIRGRGVQKQRPGDLYLVLRPTVPSSDDPEVLAAAEQIEAAYGQDVRADLRL